MFECQFDVGDRVRYVGQEYIDNLNHDDEGTVVNLLPNILSNAEIVVQVRWDRNINGHDCSGYCDEPHGWNVRQSELSLAASQNDPVNIDEALLSSILGA